jgi:hypothetical protein
VLSLFTYFVDQVRRYDPARELPAWGNGFSENRDLSGCYLHRRPGPRAILQVQLEERFQTLHEFVTQARTNLNRNTWDYLIGGFETEMTLAGNRAARDAWGSRLA